MENSALDQPEAAGLLDYIRVIRARAWIIVAIVVIAVAVSVGVTINLTPQYKAYARLLYQKNNLDQALFGSQVFSGDSQDREVQTGAALVKLESVAQSVATQLKTSLSAQSLLHMVSVQSSSSTNLVDIQAVSLDPNLAANVANAFADQFVVFRRTADRATVAAARQLVREELDSLTPEDASSSYGLMLKEKYESLRILESMQDGGFAIVQQATPPTGPFTPRPVRNGVLALIGGLVAGLVIAFLFEYLDRRIKDEKTLEQVLGVPVLASVPSVGGRWRGERTGMGARNSLPVGFRAEPTLLEAFRTLRSSLQYFSVGQQCPVWLITSGLPQEGKTVTTVNLGLSLALSGKRAILIEADLRRPMIHEYLPVDGSAGLSDILAGTKTLAEVIQRVRADEFVEPEARRREGHKDPRLLVRNLYVVPAGPLPPNPAELLASDHMVTVIRELAEQADCVLIDTPPMLVVSDALTLAQHTDGVLLASRLFATTRDEAREIKSVFDRAGVRMIGVVAGGAKRSPAYYHKRDYGYLHSKDEPARE
jgi:polysaccharide biosynthesis transport protein